MVKSAIIVSSLRLQENRQTLLIYMYIVKVYNIEHCQKAHFHYREGSAFAACMLLLQVLEIRLLFTENDGGSLELMYDEKSVPYICNNTNMVVLTTHWLI